MFWELIWMQLVNPGMITQEAGSRQVVKIANTYAIYNP